MKKLVTQRTDKWSADMIEDPVQDRLAAIIEAKKRGRKKEPEPARKTAAPTGGNVIDIMDVLGKCIASEARRSK